VRKKKCEKNKKKHVSFYAKESEIKTNFFFYMPMTLLVYKEACFNSNKINSYIPSVYVSL
jgi:hypothetical protein